MRDAAASSPVRDTWFQDKIMADDAATQMADSLTDAAGGDAGGGMDPAMMEQLMAAMGLPGGGRNALPVRLARHFHMIGVLAPPSTTILSIFTKILQWHCNRSSFDPAHPLVTALDPYVKATLDGAC